MLVNPPVLVYSQPHHWMWMVHQVLRLGRILGFWFFLLVFAFLLELGNEDIHIRNSARVSIAALVSLAAGYCLYLYLNWKNRTISLYSDGRLEYVFGIFRRECRSVSMRFGSVHYIYHNRISVWLDYADLILPFDSGTIEAIAAFHSFWEMAYDRMR